MRVEGGKVEIGAVFRSVAPVEHHRGGQLHGDERFAAALESAGGLKMSRAALIDQGVQQVAGGLVLDGSYLLPTTPRTSSAPVIGLVRTVA